MKKIKASLKGRVCKFSLCKHVLSIYNHETYCHVHLGMVGSGPKQKVAKA